MYKDKEVVIRLSREADEIYEELNKIVGDEKKRKITSSFHQSLFRSIRRARDLLKDNPFAGNQIPKRLIPKGYKIKYDVENLWRMELANRWRMLYTITGNKLEILAFVLDIFDHKDYDKLLGYKH
jgi:plasmid maintenance system killer protein